jgi:hypothetical protein
MVIYCDVITHRSTTSQLCGLLTLTSTSSYFTSTPDFICYCLVSADLSAICQCRCELLLLPSVNDHTNYSRSNGSGLNCFALAVATSNEPNMLT